MSGWNIRLEAAGDEAAIRHLVDMAFAGQPHSDGGEAEIVANLRKAGSLSLSLVAEQETSIVGHVAFSPVEIGDGTAGWYGLGPVCVSSLHRCRGIGATLIRRGLAELRSQGAKGIVVLGDPRYYRRFGFVHDPDLAYPGPPAELFQRLVLDGGAPGGVVRYAPAFG